MVIPSRSYLSGENKTEELDLPLMELEAVIIATNNFSDSNKLGHGGFGIVYKVEFIKHDENRTLIMLDYISYNL